MREKQNKILLTTLLLLIGTIAVVVRFQAISTKPFVDKTLFKIDNPKSIDRVELLSRNDTVVLEFKNTRWVVDETETADRTMIDVLFATLLQTEPKQPAAEKLKDSLTRAIESSGVEVRLLEKQKLMKEFKTAGNAAKTQTYFMDKDKNVYIVNIPGYRVYVAGIFEQPKDAWRDKYVFAFNWKNFKNLKTEFASAHKNNFEVEMKDSFFSVKNFPTDTAKLNNFLDAISLLTVDEYIELDTLTTMQPALTITVKDVADRNYALSIFNFSKAKKTACLVKDKQAAWIDNQKLARVIKNQDFFKRMP
jgi:hypothetical protein